MDCKSFKENIWALFDDEAADETLRREMLEHADGCTVCAEYLRQIEQTVEDITPRGETAVPADLGERIIARIRAQRQNDAEPQSKRSVRRLFLRIAGAAVSVAAVVLLVISVLPTSPVRAASDCFRTASLVFDDVRTLVINLNIRTLPRENFSYIDPSAAFVPHRIEVVYGEPAVWRVDKGGRTAVCDGREQFVWIDGGEGFICGLSGNFIEDLSIFVDPRALMLRESEYAAHRRDVEYSKTISGDTVRVVVNAAAQGDWSQSDYARNSSITESDNRREYLFDSRSGRLLSAKITVRTADGESTVLETESITYDASLDVTVVAARPDDIIFRDLRKLEYGSLTAGISPEKTADMLLDALAVWDTDVLNELLVYYPLDAVRELYGGCVKLKVGDSFRSGEYAGVFVPAEIMLRNGKKERLAIALRNDNPTGSWVVDGGL